MKSLEKIQSIFEKYTTSYHFYLRDLRTGQEYELGEKKRYPICSCFKLAVLMAYFDSIENVEQLYEEVTISPEKFSPGGGVINYLNGPVKLTYFHLAQLMIAFSDGTATDFLAEYIGIEKCNQLLRRYAPNSNFEKNLTETVKIFNTELFNLSQAGVDRATANILVFEEHFKATDFTHGKDIAELAWQTFQFGNSNKFRVEFLEIYRSRRFHIRTAMFIPSHMRFIGKSGSLGFGFYMNDSGCIFMNDEPVGYFGYTSEGSRHSKDIIEMVLGFVGLEIARLFDPKLVPNHLYTPTTAALLIDV